MQPGNQQGRARLLALGLVLQAFFSQFPVLIEQDREAQLGGVGRQAAQVDLADDPPGEASGDGPKVFLEAADHHGVEDFLGPDRDAPAEALGVEDFEQCGEAVRVPVVRGGRKKETVLEPACQIADGPGDLRIDRILRAARRGGVVGLVEDEQRSGPEVSEPVTKCGGVGLVDQQSVRHQEPRVCRPRVDPVSPLLPDPGDVLLVEDLEDHAEAVLELFMPLQEHRWRTGHHDILNLLAEQEFSGDQPGLDRLAEAHIIGDEEVHPRQAEGLLKGLQLIGIDPDTGPEGGLEEVRVGGCHTVPHPARLLRPQASWREKS